MIRNIIFDLGGVLINLQMQAMLERFKQIGIDPGYFFVKGDTQNASTICDGLSVGEVLTDYQKGSISTRELIQTIANVCDDTVSTEQIIEAWNWCLADLPAERLQAIADLRAKGYRTYLLSNTNDLHWKHIEQKCIEAQGFKCSELFDDLFLSHEIHLAKPFAETYKYVLDSIGTDGSDCLFIDDTMLNVEASNQAGLPAIWLDLSKGDVVSLLRDQNIL